MTEAEARRLTPHSRPLVSVVVPMLDELGAIEACLDAFARQTYGADHLEVVVVDGGSTDGSREWVERYQRDHPWVRVIDNPQRKAAAAFNCGIDAARGEVLVLFSAHGEPAVDFVERSVEVLGETGAAGVGGRYLHVGRTPASRAIGLAMVSRFGMASPHRTVTERAEVDTISHPAYVTAAMRATGRFDESLERNSDYEFNHRMREAGFALLVDPSIESIYRPRPSLRALARQFWWYGRWKARVIRRHPSSMKLRHAVPPLAVLALGAAPVVAASGPLGRRVVAAGAGAYLAGVGWAVVTDRPTEHGADPLLFAASFPVMHASWGAGLLASMLEDSLPAARR